MGRHNSHWDTRKLIYLAALFAFGLLGACPAPAFADPALAMHGAPALPADFDHLPYANPDAPRGGKLRLAYLGAFDSLNPFNVRALSTAQGLVGNVYQSLMFRTADEPFTFYGLIAKSVETNAARDHVVFHLDPRAHFSDGAPINAQDVLFSFRLLREKGRPQQRAAYRRVVAAEAPDPETVSFDLTGAGDRELPLTLALLPVLSKAHVDAEHFEDQTLQIPVGSGPYRVAEAKPGERLILERDPGYWARDLPVMRGLYNFDAIEILYFRDSASMFEAFKAGLIDYRIEDDATRWLTGYDFPAAHDGRVLRASVPTRIPKSLAGFAFNTRRALFADTRVREALAGLFDFEWINANLYGGLFRRTTSLFAESDLASTDLPASPAERALLAPFPGAVRDDILEGRWRPPVSDGTGRDRGRVRHALDELAGAGWTLREGTLRDARGDALAFEILVHNRQEERLALAYAQSLARIGVVANVRLVDEVQFLRRRDRFDFDVIVGLWAGTPSPGAEERGRWGSSEAANEGSFNLAGARSPAIDAAIEALLAAREREDFVAAARALDRAVLSGFYVVPFFHAPDVWIAYSADLGRPARDPLFGPAIETWWRNSR